MTAYGKGGGIEAGGAPAAWTLSLITLLTCEVTVAPVQRADTLASSVRWWRSSRDRYRLNFIYLFVILI
jgi:hypothetical protein